MHAVCIAAPVNANVGRLAGVGVEVTLTWTGGGKNYRGSVCKSSWKNNHQCPESNQPFTAPEGTSLGHGAYAAQLYIAGQTLADKSNPAFNLIADANCNPSGLGKTCDEWPSNL